MPIVRRVAHVITTLSTGGAEVMLYRLLRHLAGRGPEQLVYVLTGWGALADRIAELGVAVTPLRINARRPGPLAPWRLSRLLREAQVSLVQTWLYHADMVGGLAAWRAGRLPLVWGLHSASPSSPQLSRRTRAVVNACRWLSNRLPDRIVACSEATREVHTAFGYDGGRMVVLPNGCDTTEYRPRGAEREAVRRELGLTPEHLVIGNIGRFHPHKDHRTLLAAVGAVRRQLPMVRLVLCGAGLTADQRELTAMVAEHGLTEQVLPLGLRGDLPRLLSAFDTVCFSSSTEALPLALLESMSAGVPCVATRVGDTAAVIGDTGLCVPPRQPRRLADALLAMLCQPPDGRAALGRAARERVATHYSLAATAAGYLACWEEVLERTHQPSTELVGRRS